MKISIRTVLAITVLKVLAMTSSAVVLDWSNLPGGATWASGSLSNSFDPDATNAGNDITVTVQANGGVAFSAGYPVNSSSAGGTIANNDASSLRLRTATMIDTNGSISVTITFTWNNPGPQFDPQIIALSNITFTPVPEVGSSFGALAMCGDLLAA